MHRENWIVCALGNPVPMPRVVFILHHQWLRDDSVRSEINRTAPFWVRTALVWFSPSATPPGRSRTALHLRLGPSPSRYSRCPRRVLPTVATPGSCETRLSPMSAPVRPAAARFSNRWSSFPLSREADVVGPELIDCEWSPGCGF